MIEENKELEQFEDLVNDYLIAVRKLEYSLVHFIEKSNKSTALAVRNVQRNIVDLGKQFKDSSIDIFKGADGGE